MAAAAPSRPALEDAPLPTPARRLADLGFLVGLDLPGRPGRGYLLVALRELPTLRGDDPERVEYWAARRGRGMRRSLTRPHRCPSTSRCRGAPSGCYTAFR